MININIYSGITKSDIKLFQDKTLHLIKLTSEFLANIKPEGQYLGNHAKNLANDWGNFFEMHNNIELFDYVNFNKDTILPLGVKKLIYIYHNYFKSIIFNLNFEFRLQYIIISGSVSEKYIPPHLFYKNKTLKLLKEFKKAIL